jgi:hypothetical protein
MNTKWKRTIVDTKSCVELEQSEEEQNHMNTKCKESIIDTNDAWLDVSTERKETVIEISLNTYAKHSSIGMMHDRNEHEEECDNCRYE